jgi:hypothetical protein
MISQNFYTTKTFKKINKVSMKCKDYNTVKKFIFHKRHRPTDLVEGILYDMEYLHSLLGTSKKTPTPTKPGYQNYTEV